MVSVHFVVLCVGKKGEKMSQKENMEELSGQMVKTVGFDIPLFRCIEKYRTMKNYSRSRFVNLVLTEYVKTHNLEAVTGIAL